MMIANAFSTKKNTFCLGVLRVMKLDSPIVGIRKSTTLIYDKYRSFYTLLVPENVEKFENKITGGVAGLDPGIRTFLTLYSHDSCYEICNNHDFSKYYTKIDKLNRCFPTEKNKQCKKYKKCIGKIYDKMNNKIRDMHLTSFSLYLH